MAYSTLIRTTVFRSLSERTGFLSAPKALEVCATRFSTASVILPEDSIWDPIQDMKTQ